MRAQLEVGAIVGGAAKAVGLSGEAMLGRIAELAEPREGGHSDPTKETILAYGRAPRTRCNYRFASLVLEFLHAAVIDGLAVDQMALRQVRELCRSVLRDRSVRGKRFERPAVSDPSSVRLIKGTIGAYVIIRRETGDRNLRQELLILSREGRGHLRTYATFVSPEVVCRGVWSVVQNTLCCSMHGQRKGHQGDIVNLHMARDLQGASHASAILGGVLTGISSLEFLPTVLPVIGIKLPERDVSSALYHLGDECDAELRSAYGALDYVMTQGEFIEVILDNALLSSKNVIVPNTITADLRRRYPRPESLVNPGILKFCESFSARDF